MPGMSSAQAVEDAFYDALRQGDLATVMSLWADDDDVVCIHPGGPRLSGLATIRESWEGILREGGLPVTPTQRQCVTGAVLAVHHVIEEIKVSSPRGAQIAHCFATNVFVKDASGWRLLSHHASPATDHVATPLPSGERLH